MKQAWNPTRAELARETNTVRTQRGQQAATPPFFLEAIEAATSIGSRVLPEPVSKRFLREYGITTPRGASGRNFDEIKNAAADLMPPFVLKVISPSIVHKSEAGGVRLGVACVEELEDAVHEMTARLRSAGHDVDGFLVEETAHEGQEMVIGAVRDRDGAFVTMIGLGGVFVEMLQDVAFRYCPLNRDDAISMLTELRGRSILDGARGHRPADVDAFVDMLCAVAGPGGLLEALPPEVVEVDLNPVIVAEQGACAADARLVISPDPPWTGMASAIPEGVREDLSPLFSPRTIGVLGASARGTNAANLFLRNLQGFEFAGEIYPVHPHADQIEGIAAYRSISETPAPIDYAFVALPATAVPDVLERAGGRVQFAQVISSGFGETAEGAVLEERLVAAGRSGGVRILGPNCLGTHSPRGRLTFVDNAPTDMGPVAVISQSGGLSVDILRLGAQQGVRFGAVVSVGNGADVSCAELLRHFLEDPETEVVGLYLESLKEGKQVLEVMRATRTEKPVVLLAGGRTVGGARAALSHTGALTGNHRLWPALAQQAGVVLVDTVRELLDTLLAFQLRDKDVEPVGSDVVLFGNGGGTSVLATDALERAGLVVPRLPESTIDALSELGLPPGTSLANPLDAPAWTLAVDDGEIAETILSTVLSAVTPAVVISHLNVGILVSNTRTSEHDVVDRLITSIGRAQDEAEGSHHLLVLRTDGDPSTTERIETYRSHAHQAGLPVFNELGAAAIAAAGLLAHERYRNRRG